MTGGEAERRSPVGRSADVTPAVESSSERMAETESQAADLAAREQAAEKNFHTLLKSPDEPLLKILDALQDYRLLSQLVTFSDFGEHGGSSSGGGAAEKSSAGLWHAHTEARKLLHRTLAQLRKAKEPLAARQMTKVYLQFIKDSQRFYRNYIFQLNKTFGGIPELEAVAHKVKHDEVDESLPRQSVAPGLRVKVLEQCHQALIYLGDISRYRTSDKLDKKPDFGPAIGYYGLACSLLPASGMGHHQQAVVALEQRHHLRAIYHLYRAIVVDRPHPNAQSNLALEFDKINAAWDRGELIEKGPPNDPEGPHRSLVGWFVRLHSMCVKGEAFRGQEELEREVMSQLSAEIKRRSLNNTLLRMQLVNFAAQHCARENLQGNPTDEYVLAYYNFLRFNLRTFTMLLNMFKSELASIDVSASDDDDEPDLKARLTEVSRRILPSLRLYSIWLLPVAHIVHGLSKDAFLEADIQQFWRAYASTIDAVIQTFPIWDLEELAEANYLLEEDVETLGFKPLVDGHLRSIWNNKGTGLLKPRYFDRDVQTLSTDEEMLVRVKAFLEDGLFLANDDEDAPIILRGSRVVLQGAEQDEIAFAVPSEALARKVEEVQKSTTAQPKRSPVVPAPKPLSYASAAANGHAKQPKPAAKPSNPAAPRSRQAELSRMVDDLVDDDDDSAANNSVVPVTPPLQPAADPVVVANGDMPYVSSAPSPNHFVAKTPYQPPQKQAAKRPPSASNSPALRTPDRRQSSPRPMHSHSISRLWNPMPGQQQQQHQQQGASSPRFSPGLPLAAAFGSPNTNNNNNAGPMTPRAGHSRVNSSTSIRSAASPNPLVDSLGSVPGPWSSLPPLPQQQQQVGPAGPAGPAAAVPLSGLGHVPAAAQTGLVSSGYTALTSSSSSAAAGTAAANNSPLLFGAGGGVWSANGGALAGPGFGGHLHHHGNATPPNGQGG